MRKKFTRYLITVSVISLCTICAYIYNTNINNKKNTDMVIDTASCQDKEKDGKNIENIKSTEYGKNSGIYLYPSKRYIYPDYKHNKSGHTSGFYVYTNYKDINSKEYGYPDGLYKYPGYEDIEGREYGYPAGFYTYVEYENINGREYGYPTGFYTYTTNK